MPLLPVPPTLESDDAVQQKRVGVSGITGTCCSSGDQTRER